MNYFAFLNRLIPLKNKIKLEYILLLLLLFSNLSFYKDYGVSIDEPRQHNYGLLVIDYYLTLGKDKSYLDFFDLKYYGPIIEVILGSFTKVFPNSNPYDIRHLCLSFFSLIGTLYFFYLLKYWFRNKFFAFLGSLVFYLVPTLFNSSFNQSKDYPFAVIYLLTLYYIVRYIHIFNKIKVTHIAKITILVSLGLLIRPSAGIVMLFSIWTIFFLHFRKSFFTIHKFKILFIISFFSFLLLAIFFPFLHKSPIKKLIEVLTIFSKFYHDIPYLYLGENISPNQTPRHYVMVNLFIYLPEMILFSIIPLFFLFKKSKEKLKRTHSILLSVTIFMLVPLLIQIILRPYLYNGIRQFMFIVPPFLLILLCGTYYGMIFWSKRIFVLQLILVIGYSLFINNIYHPYQNIYQNTISNLPLEKSKYFSHYYDYSHFKKIAQLINEDANLRNKTHIIYDHSYDNIYNKMISLGIDEHQAKQTIQSFKFKWDVEIELYKFYLSNSVKITKNIEEATIYFSENPLLEYKVLSEIRIGEHLLGTIYLIRSHNEFSDSE